MLLDFVSSVYSQNVELSLYFSNGKASFSVSQPIFKTSVNHVYVHTARYQKEFIYKEVIL